MRRLSGSIVPPLPPGGMGGLGVTPLAGDPKGEGMEGGSSGMGGTLGTYVPQPSGAALPARPTR